MYDGSIEKLKESKIYLAIVSPSFMKDSRIYTQLGYAMLLDKPIYLLVVKGVVLPKNLAKVAAHIEYVDTDNENLKEAAESLVIRIKEELKT